MSRVPIEMIDRARAMRRELLAELFPSLDEERALAMLLRRHVALGVDHEGDLRLVLDVRVSPARAVRVIRALFGK